MRHPLTITLATVAHTEPELTGIDAERELRAMIEWKIEELDDRSLYMARGQAWQRKRNFWGDLKDATITVRKD